MIQGYQINKRIAPFLQSFKEENQLVSNEIKSLGVLPINIREIYHSDIYNIEKPYFSNDGKQIAFIESGEKSFLTIIDTTGTIIQKCIPVPYPGGNTDKIFWNFDNSQLLFSGTLLSPRTTATFVYNIPLNKLKFVNYTIPLKWGPNTNEILFYDNTLKGVYSFDYKSKKENLVLDPKPFQATSSTYISVAQISDNSTYWIRTGDPNQTRIWKVNPITGDKNIVLSNDSTNRYFLEGIDAIHGLIYIMTMERKDSPFFYLSRYNYKTGQLIKVSPVEWTCSFDNSMNHVLYELNSRDTNMRNILVYTDLATLKKNRLLFKTKFDMVNFNISPDGKQLAIVDAHHYLYIGNLF